MGGPAPATRCRAAPRPVGATSVGPVPPAGARRQWLPRAASADGLTSGPGSDRAGRCSGRGELPWALDIHTPGERTGEPATPAVRQSVHGGEAGIPHRCTGFTRPPQRCSRRRAEARSHPTADGQEFKNADGRGAADSASYSRSQRSDEDDATPTCKKTYGHHVLRIHRTPRQSLTDARTAASCDRRLICNFA